MKDYHNKHRNLLKLYKTRQNNLKYKAKIAKFQHKAKSLFVICSSKFKKEAFCRCPMELKAIKDEKVFSVDQRSVRKIIIGNIGRVKTAQLQKRSKRKQLDFIRKAKRTKTEESDSNIEIDYSSLPESEIDTSAFGEKGFPILTLFKPSTS